MYTSLGKWALEALKVYHPFTGITTREFQKMKRLQRQHEVPVDSVVLTLYDLLQRGLAGILEKYIMIYDINF